MGTFPVSLVWTAVRLATGTGDFGDTSEPEPGLGVCGASVATGELADRTSFVGGAAAADVAAGGSGAATGAGISPLGFWIATLSTSSGLNSLLRRSLRRLVERASLGEVGEVGD